MSHTVWVIEQGSDSDYRVVGIFSTQANAERIKDFINGADPYEPATVAEWPFDPAVAEIQKGYQCWSVRMRRDGSIEQIESYTCSINPVHRVSLWERSRSDYYQPRGVPDVLCGVIWAKDETHAMKIMNEHRAQFIALGKWKE